MLKPLHLFLFLTFFLWDAYANNFRYNEDRSVKENEKLLERILKMGCKDFGLSTLESPKTLNIQKILDTYPKELLFKYYKDNKDSICFYNFSFLTKYLYKDFSQKVSTLFLELTEKCLVKQSQKSSQCLLDKEVFYIDTVNILGTICSKESLRLASALNCHYVDFKRKKCQLLSYTDYKSCPDYQNHRVELRSFHKNFINKCSRLKWRWPHCMKGI